MEVFSEIYSSYYRAVETILRQAQEKSLTDGEIRNMLAEFTFSESALTILPKLQNGSWPLLQKTGRSSYSAACAPLPENPLSSLQKAWLRALLDDPRIRLFFAEADLGALRQALSGEEPLYRREDFHLFDQALDRDDYASPDYQNRFRAFLNAICEKTALRIQYEGGKGKRVSGVFWPFRLEYSQKDDKFRAHCHRRIGSRTMPYTFNLGRVESLEPVRLPTAADSGVKPAIESARHKPRFREVVLEITRERNALERSMVQFAHFEKRTEYDESADRYISTIRYNAMDESELVIRVLSFGPTVRVISPDSFVREIRERVQKQTDLIFRDRMAPE